MADEEEDLTARMNHLSLVMAENKLLRTMNTELRSKHTRDVEKISDLENQIASFEPSAKNARDADKIFNLKQELDALFQAKEASDNLLEIAKAKLKESEKKNKAQGLELKMLTEIEASKKRVMEMHLKRAERANKDQK